MVLTVSNTPSRSTGPDGLGISANQDLSRRLGVNDYCELAENALFLLEDRLLAAVGRQECDKYKWSVRPRRLAEGLFCQ